MITDPNRFLEKLFTKHKTCAGLRKGLDSSSNKKLGYSNIPGAPRATSSQAEAAGRWRSLPQPGQLDIQTPLATASLCGPPSAIEVRCTGQRRAGQWGVGRSPWPATWRLGVLLMPLNFG